MRYFLVLASVVGMLIVSACASNPQGTQEVRDNQTLNIRNNDTMEEHHTKRGLQQTDNPKQMNQVGETWGIRLDKEKVHEAIDLVDGVEVRRVNFTGSHAYVSIRATQDNLSDDERKVLENKAQTAVENALPRYRIRVKMR
ncbi:hypothetical protein GLW08_14795 [Pontibacillus yanchengensis]|uniref:Uncharacterized protein n=2 Tax=Pontibacillus yanchengensis TaxID=462910 RepID=A0ACC7VK91_9BACI|nr:hypothetical protein [Pontibacillus yanchengensis]MYL35682.1 hypothetical protein [Pontibacillus yanchengensis]MYL54601.1 hypothetical protein [Pontibacillus yanchengensis]